MGPQSPFNALGILDMTSPSTRLKVLIATLTLLTVALLLIRLSPSEETLGNLVKLIYFHGAVVYTAFFSFMIAGILGAIYLIRSRPTLYRWILAYQKTAVLYWLVYFLSSIVLTYLAWGGVGWMEPRFQLAIRILVLISTVFLITLWVDRPKIIALLNLVLFLTVFFLTSRVGRIFHPSNPIGRSNSSSMKVYAVLILLIFMVTSLGTAYLMLSPQDRTAE